MGHPRGMSLFDLSTLDWLRLAMSWTEKSLGNPAAVAVVVAIAALLGGLAIFRLPVQLMPDVEQTKMLITTVWPGASSAEIESEIAEPVEEVMQGIPGLERLSSYSAANFSWVELTFTMGTGIDSSMLEVISRLNRLPPLPADVERPVLQLGSWDNTERSLIEYYIQKSPDAQSDIMEDRQFIEDVVLPRLRSVQGVANVAFQDGTSTGDQLQIVFDPYRAADLRIDITNIAGFVSSGTDVSGGFVDVGRRQYAIRFEGRYTPEELGDLVLDWRDGRPVYLRDIAEISVGPGRRDGHIYQNGAPAFSLGVESIIGANVLATLADVRAVVAEFNQGEFKARQLEARSLYDPSVYIWRAIKLLAGNLFVGVMLAVGALWWFLRRFRATLIIAAAIPISLLSTFLFLELAGRSLNIISLAGLAFATGMVLDAAIVVLENIVRMRERGIEPEKASRDGTSQVRGALFASTATTVAIFIPLVFMKGEEGQIFADLALTIAIAVAISFITAITVLPTAAKVWLRDKGRDEDRVEFWHRAAGHILSLTDNRLKRLIWIAGLTLGSALIVLKLWPTLNYLPAVQRDASAAFIQLPPGISADQANEIVKGTIVSRLEAHRVGGARPAISEHAIQTLSNSTFAILNVLPEEGENFEDVKKWLEEDVLGDIPGINAFVFRQNLFGGFEGNDTVQLRLQTSDLETFRNIPGPLFGILTAAVPGATINMSFGNQSPALEFIPDDGRISEAGWSRAEAGLLIRAFGDGLWLGEHFDGEKRLDIIMKSTPWADPEEFLSIPVVTPNGDLVPLGQLVKLRRTVTDQMIERANGRRAMTIWMNPAKGMSLKQLLDGVQAVEADLLALLPADGRVTYGGSAGSLDRAVSAMSFNFAIAVLLLFMIMTALFQSLKDSAIVVISIPVALVGGLVSLRLLDTPLDLLTMIGFIILLGLVVNNAILLVAQTRNSQSEGMSRLDAIRRGLELRLRPIFMTTMTSIFGMLPLLLLPGEGSVIYRGMAAVIVGGMLVSTFGTLVLMPSLLQLGTSRRAGKARTPNETTRQPAE